MAKPELKRFGRKFEVRQKIVPEFKSGVRNAETFAYLGLDEKDLLKESASFLEKEIGCPVEIQSADSPEYDPQKKSRFAEPLRPAIYIEEKKEE